MNERSRERAPQVSMEVRVVALGCVLRPLERISVMGQLLGLGSRSTAYRMSVGWPLVGPKTSRRVLVIPLLERYGIPYTIENSSDTDTGVAADEQLIRDCGGC